MVWLHILLCYWVSKVMVFQLHAVVLWEFPGNRHLRVKRVTDFGHFRFKDWHIWP